MLGKGGGHGNGNGHAEFIGGVVKPETIWACTTCYACVDHCPVRNEHVPLIVQMRRRLVEEGKMDDGNLQDALMSLQRYGNSQSKSPKKRFDWAKDLPKPLKRHQGVLQVAVVHLALFDQPPPHCTIKGTCSLRTGQ